MDGGQGSGSKSSQAHRSRGSACIGNARSRSKSSSRAVKKVWQPKEVRIQDPATTEVSDPPSGCSTTKIDEFHARQRVSDADDSDAYGGAVSDAESSNAKSIPGDSVVDSDSDVEARARKRSARAQPRVKFHGDARSRGESSKFNDEPEVGNIGIFCGNWGSRASLSSSDDSKVRRTERSDRQIKKCPAQLLILQEASPEVEEVLSAPAAEAEDPGSSGLAGRCGYEYFVVRGDEPKTAVLMAARMDNCTYLELLEYDPFIDNPYPGKSKKKEAVSRMLTCKVGFKQNVGHLGKSLVAIGVHGHAKTMKIMWPLAWQRFWDRLADKIKKFGAEIVAGDFNMSLTKVVPELRSRGLEVDCIAWYPWFHKTEQLFGQHLGFDSCGIFYIGGMVQVKLQWSLNELDILTMVTDDVGVWATEVAENKWNLHWYSGANVPGQPWKCYRSVRYEETDGDKDLRARLTELLTPSTLQEVLDQIPKRDGRIYCPYLLRDGRMFKPVNLEEWFVPQAVGDPLVLNGAHLPTCVFTNNARARSKKKQEERAARHHLFQRVLMAKAK